MKSAPVTRTERPFRPGSAEEKLFLAAVSMIPRHYRSFNMACVMDDLNERGTVCCFAGIVALLCGIDLSRNYHYDSIWTEIGRKRLGLTIRYSERLFYPFLWPDEFRDRSIALLPQTREYAANAVERYMHFYETGE